MERVKKPKESGMQGGGLVSMPTGLFVEVLGGIPPDDWGRVWVPERTIMLRKTSRAVQEAMDKMMLPVVVRVNRWFWFQSRGSCDERWRFILQQLLALAARSKITTLELLCAAGVDMGGLAGVLSLCPGLAQLHMRSNGMLGAVGTGLVAGMLGRVRLLTHLALRRNGMGAGGVGLLAAVLPLLPALVRVDVSCNDFGAEGIRALAPALPLCPVLAQVDVSCNLVGVEGGKSLGGVLRQCAVLTHLNLADNGLTELDGLAGGLVECASLTHVNLANNELSEDGTDMLVAVLACCRLQFLDLKNCVRSGSVARGLGLCTSLTELRLPYNSIRGAVAVEYARALQGCTGLTRLDLRGNEFSMHATSGLSALLPQYAGLVELSLPYNSIRVVGAGVLLAAAGGCASLRHLDLHNNYIRDDYRVWPKSRDARATFSVSFMGLLDVLRGCTTLAGLNLAYNDFSEEGTERLLASWGGCAGGLVLCEA